MNAIIEQLANGIATGLVYALVAAGLSLLFKGLDTVNFAHGEFYVLGGVAIFVITRQLGLNPWLGVLAAVVGTAILGVVLHFLLIGVLRDSPLNVLLATFAVSLLISNLVSYAFGGIPQPVQPLVPGALTIGPVVLSYQRVIAAGISLAATLVLIVWLRWSRRGRTLRAVADNREGARIIGINTRGVDRLLFVVAAVSAGLAGALMAPVSQVSPFAGLPVVVTAFVVVVLGGVGSVGGALIGGIVLGVAEALTVALAGIQWAPAVGYVLLLVVMLFRGPIEQWIRDEQERERMRRRQTIESIVTAAVLILAWPILAATGSSYGQSVMALIGIYYLLAVSLNMIMGFTDLISFGQAAFFAIGAYSATLTATYLGAGLVGGALVGIILSAVLALVVASVSRALSGVYFALATMAAAELVHIVILNWVDLTRGPLGLNLPAADKVLVPGIPLTGNAMFHLTLAVAIVVTIVMGLVVRSDTGMRSIGIRENADLSASIGIVPARQRALAFLISGTIASVGGSLYAFTYGILTPSVASLTYSALALLMVIFGGRGTILGPLVGAAVFVIVPDAIGLEGALGQVVFALILLLVVLLLPRGVVGSIGVRGGSAGGVIGWAQAYAARRKAI